MCGLQTEIYAISKDYIAMDTTPHGTITQTKTIPVSHRDPTANLTFDLRLSLKEKEARSQVVLPYTNQQGQHLQGTQLDDPQEEEEEEDFNSDPDDDLDF